MSQALMILQKSLPVNNLSAYIHAANAMPMLTAEEEHELAVRFHEKQDVDAARHLVLAHMRFVIRVARGFEGYGLGLVDLIQEGSIGLMKAVHRFDPHRSIRLVSFAVHWIKAEMHEFIIRNWKIVKMATTKAQRKLFFNLRSMKKRLGWFTREEVESVAAELGVSPKEVLQMESRLNAMDAAYDGVSHDEDKVYFPSAPAHYLSTPGDNPADLLESSHDKAHHKQHLLNALQTLDARSQDILQQRWLSEEKTTLHDLAAKYCVSAERIRQLENNAMRKIREHLEKHDG